MNKFGWILLSLFYIAAGLNHFRDPEFYMPLIPEYFPFPQQINIVSGVVEILLGILIIPVKTRKFAAFAIILMLLAFIPSHIYFIQVDGCAGKLCVPLWVAWVRLIIIHPLLLLWAWKYTK